MKITHIIGGLNIGGAEMMLYKLLLHSNKDKYPAEVISLTDIGPLGKDIQALGVPVRALHINALNLPVGILRIAWLLRKSNPDIVQTWMHYAGVIGGIAAVLSGRSIPVIWGVRFSNLPFFLTKKKTLLFMYISAILSYWLPAKIICVSESARRAHEKVGYDKKKMLTIPNGFDEKRFRPDSAARVWVRKELQLAQETFLIGSVARFDPLKDQHTLMKAATIAVREDARIHFVLCGKGMTWDNDILVSWIKKNELQAHAHLLGERDDIPRLTASFNVATLSSISEGFSNAVGEAMACGVPCVITNVGDAKNIVGDAGIVVPPQDAKALAAGWLQIHSFSEDKRRKLGELARKRVVKYFSIDSVVRRYYYLYEKICSS